MDSSGSDQETEVSSLAPHTPPDIQETIITESDRENPRGTVSGTGHNDEVANPDLARITLRAYQKEMLEMSLRQNVIVAMDTGSGKTQVAVRRISAELNKGSSDKLIWFLAPTVSLCYQQFEVIELQIPAVNIKIITGNDAVHTWNGHVWDELLRGVQIVVTTYQVLLDALIHAFIRMDKLALIVFDEAHNCTRKHPGRKIMTDYYHPLKVSGIAVPSILGLTASPSTRSKVKELEALETTLDAKCIAPTVHREDLVRCVSKPQVIPIVYTMSSPENTVHTPSMRALHNIYNSLDINQDPYIRRLLDKPNEKNERRRQEALKKRDTYVQNQVKGLYHRSIEICRQLGPWAADRFLWKTLTAFLDQTDLASLSDGFKTAENIYLANHLRGVSLQWTELSRGQGELSAKVEQLLQLLLDAQDNIIAIIFVKERASVTMLSEVLSANQSILGKYHIGTMVGASSMAGKRKNIYEFEGNKDLKTLDRFRTGEVNLLIATSVLEEGIDVPACNLVICYDQPDTPKSFIQRRGRARMRNSTLALFLERSAGILKEWQSLEEELRAQYEDEQREFQQLELLEESELTGTEVFVVGSTGARLDLDTAKQHLEHLCNCLTRGDFIDNRPDYIIETLETQKRVTATVSLPLVVPPELRLVKGAKSWLSEKNATKDAAFQAYVALYKAGFVDENLLPFLKPREASVVEGRASELEVEEVQNPWSMVAQLWKQPGVKWRYPLSYRDSEGQTIDEYDLVLPVKLEQLRDIPMYIDHNVTHWIHFESAVPITDEEIEVMPDDTTTLLASNFAHRWDLERQDHVVRITAKKRIHAQAIGQLPFDTNNSAVKKGEYLVRDQSQKLKPYIFDGILESKPRAEEVQRRFYGYEDAPADVPYLVLKDWTKRSDFLHPVMVEQSKQASEKPKKPFARVLPLPWARVDTMPVRHVQFGMLIPSIIHELEVMLLAKELSDTIINPIGFNDLELVRAAMTSGSAGGPTNYERLEFLGDSILKYCAVIHVYSKHPNLPESYLSPRKDAIASNSRLCKASVDNGLARFIITKRFTGHKWRPKYTDDLLEHSGSSRKRKLSTKTLADVVEALVGAAYIDGGINKAMKCLSVFLKEFDWEDIQLQREFIYNQETDNTPLPSVLEPLEDLIGYSFHKKTLLIQAMTHGAYVADLGSRTLERLEFLGDAVLDYIIVKKLITVKPPLPHYRMHTLKTAMVNGDFLAFLSLENSVAKKQSVLVGDRQVGEKDVQLSLWQFMRHTDRAIGLEQAATLERYKDLRNDLIDSFKHGIRYPWATLSRLRANKFYSDIFEALLGAIWVDSRSIETCEAVVTRFGILPYLERVLRDSVHMLHPKEDLGVLAGSQTVKYVIANEPGGSDGEKRYGCKAYVGDRLVAQATGGGSREEIMTVAATNAVEVLTREKQANGEI